MSRSLQRSGKGMYFTLAIAAVVATAAAILVLFGMLISENRVQAQAVGSAPDRINGKPNLNGIWQTNNTANWALEDHAATPLVAQEGRVPGTEVLAAPVVALGTMGWRHGGMGVVEGGKIPYLPWAAQRRQENFDDWIERDPELKCFQPGIPRAIYMPFPFEIIQGDNKIMMVFEFANAERTIHLDEMEEYPNVAFMGYSTGHWEGDTLVVDVTDFTDATWFDRAGDFHSDALHVTERYTPAGPDVIMYEATMEDPLVFSEPWTIKMPIYRRLEEDARLSDFRCVQMAEETMYGHLRAEPLVTHWEGKTMDIDITHKIPPGEEVYERYISGNPPE